MFDPSLDLRRKDARQRTVVERDSYRSILLEVLHGLRQEPTRAEELLDFIRNSPAVDPIIALLEQHPETHSDAKSPDTTGFASAEDALLSLCPQQEPHAMGNNWGSLLYVPAKPWTRVTDSDEMVSHLISLFFTWDHPCLQVLDQSIFLAYMNSDTASAFCTPFLVNCILALAIVCCFVLASFSWLKSVGSLCSSPIPCSWEMHSRAGLDSSQRPKAYGKPKKEWQASPMSKVYCSCATCKWKA